MTDQAIILSTDGFSAFEERMTNRILNKLVEEVGKIRGSMIDRPLTRKEAAVFCRISERAFDRLVKDGIVKAYRLENHRAMFLASELMGAIKKEKKKAP